MKSGAFWFGIIAGIILSAVVGIVVLPMIGVFDMTATGNKNILDWWGETNLENTIEKNAPTTSIPTTASADKGMEHFASTCLQCHGSPDAPRRDWAETMLPKPPMLWQGDTQEMSDGEIFYVVRNGIRMSGMPAFGPHHQDEELWNIVKLVRQLDGLTQQQKERLLQASSTKHNASEEGEHHGQ